MMKTKSEFKKTEIGFIPEEWEIKTLDEVIEKIIDHRGKTPLKLGGNWSKTGYRAISARNIKDGRLISEESINCVDENLYRKWMPDEIEVNDILLTSEAPLGECMIWKSTKKIVLSQRVFGLRANKSIANSDYLFWFIRSRLFQNELFHRQTGTTVQGIRQSELRGTKVVVPPISEQRIIAKIFSDLDSKIELNQQMNKTLEAIGRATFKHWFIDFEFPNENGRPYKSSGGDMVYNEELGKEIPRGWEASNIEKEFNLVMGQSPPGSSYNNIGDGTVFFQGRTDFGDRFPSIRMFCTKPTRFAKKDDTLISVRAPVGDINLALQDCCIGRGLAAIRHKSNHSSYTYYFIMALKPAFDHFESEGTIFGSIGKTDFEKIKVIAPNKKIINLFQSVLEPIDKKMVDNTLQTLTLSSIRDSLLPKLMSGKIRVPVEAR